jgi:protein-tyrosine phosphatase
MTEDRPHENCYWLEPGRLLAGEYPGHWDEETARQRLRNLLAAEITFFLDLTTPEDGLERYEPLLREEARAMGKDVVYRAMPLRDMSVPDTREPMRAILDLIDAALADGHRVYFHCWGGIGRTGTVAGCYLVRHGSSGPAALVRLAEHWRTVAKRGRYPETPQTLEQRKWVAEWTEVS